MSAGREGPPPGSSASPRDVRVDQLEVSGERFLVVSYDLEVGGALRLEERLSASEAQVAKLVIQGLSNAEIATRRGTSVRTVANQVASILRKLGMESRNALMAHSLVTGRSRSTPR